MSVIDYIVDAYKMDNSPIKTRDYMLDMIRMLYKRVEALEDAVEEMRHE